ncbi:MAG: hypothetical protein UV73_C0008G0017 [Candidatus Gottesmanbacteria bacterium GW2011_GWA2_43_14]|uniref:HicB-like antitoxin of toxin-antitoxin system domain-containing protein n=1 Tax=Candidatus Gottesmanbacteria bacterium GW2011_GWA2_43_14 TaxID=1618443 RepID=A0A0G1DIS4_9BACT|nr:MAG: hypothetical protein UV73_C0008G0017 [Candidatus Gottesmanbacteria bacterium GW2011_GWA2_43_14]
MNNKIKKRLKSGLNILLWQEGKWFVAKCVEVEIASQGKTKKEALKNIEEALELYFEDEKISPPDPLTNLELHSIPL